MTSPDDGPTLDDVMDTEENVTRDRTQHAKDPHPSDEVLEHRTEMERQAVVGGGHRCSVRKRVLTHRP